MRLCDRQAAQISSLHLALTCTARTGPRMASGLFRQRAPLPLARRPGGAQPTSAGPPTLLCWGLLCLALVFGLGVLLGQSRSHAVPAARMLTASFPLDPVQEATGARLCFSASCQTAAMQQRVIWRRHAVATLKAPGCQHACGQHAAAGPGACLQSRRAPAALRLCVCHDDQQPPPEPGCSQPSLAPGKQPGLSKLCCCAAASECLRRA